MKSFASAVAVTAALLVSTSGIAAAQAKTSQTPTDEHAGHDMGQASGAAARAPGVDAPAVAAGKVAAGQAAPGASSTSAPHVPIINAQGREIGTAVFTSTPHGVLITVDARGLPPGEHAMHLHQTGTCDAAAGFTSAGGHFAPGGTSHGYEVAGGPHAGDMPNQFVASDGTLKTEVFNPNVTLTSGKAALMDADGSALIIHAGVDDYRSQPTGEAGGRLACAALKPAK